MRPGSTDGFLTLLASVMMAALLFVGRTVIENRGDGWLLPQRGDSQATQVDSSIGSEDVEDRRPFGEPAEPIEEFSPTRSFPNETTASRPPAEPQVPPEVATKNTFKVVGIVDGDTIDILVNRSPLRLRLNGIDTPEKGQPFGNNAKDDLSQLIGGKQVRYAVRDSDRYGRSIADVYLGDLYVNQWLVQQGLAWHYVAYSNDPALDAAEAEAKAAKRGLWSDPRRVPPWNWRNLSKLEREEFG